MTFQAQAVAAYGESQAHIRTDRSTEYEAIARITRDLAMRQAQKSTSYPNFVQAVHSNRRLWIHLAASVADQDNSLASNLRAQIFYLAEFTQHHSSKVLRGDADVDVLVEINTGIMRGLGATGGHR